jgi:hypothetical protein
MVTLTKGDSLNTPAQFIQCEGGWWGSTSEIINEQFLNLCMYYGIYSEQVDFQDAASWERNMDDLILRAAIWQEEHWID